MLSDIKRLNISINSFFSGDLMKYSAKIRSKIPTKAINARIAKKRYTERSIEAVMCGVFNV